jgi:hypothetical protein
MKINRDRFTGASTLVHPFFCMLSFQISQTLVSAPAIALIKYQFLAIAAPLF